MTDTSWNYRIIRTRDGNLELCEAYYSADGSIFEIVRPPIFGAVVAAGETVDHIGRNLRRARDAIRKSIIDEKELALPNR